MKYTRNNVLIIDSDIALTTALEVVLNKYDIKLTSFSDSFSALKELTVNKYDILIVNYLLDGIKGDQLISMIREHNKDIYIILMSSHKDITPSVDIMRSLDIQAFFEKGATFDDLILLIESGYKHVEQIEQIKSMTSQIEHFGIEFATAMTNAVGARDNYTKEHSTRVSKYVAGLAKQLNLDEEHQKMLVLAATFHDIGKIGISDTILLKDTKLTDDEYEKVKLHPVIGVNILSASSVFKKTIPAVMHHHERIDGKGYPDGIKGDDIPYDARLLAVCDTFDAITSTRIYRKALSIKEAIAEIEISKGTQLDEKISDTFIDYVKKNTKAIQDIIKMR